jgi:chromosomal replication initiation ATPase DnaA
MNAEQAWQSVLGQLQMEMPRASFDTWVRGTKPLSYQDGTSTVGVRNAYAREWLASRLASTVKRLPVTILKVRGWVNHLLKGVDEISMLNRFGDVSKEFEEQLQDIRQQIEQADLPLGLAIAVHGPVPIWKQVDMDFPRWQRQVMEAISWDEE